MRRMDIVVKGQIDQNWSDWFDSFEITHTTAGETRLTGTIRDQAELRGILSRLADLGLELISVNTLSARYEPEEPRTGGGEYKKKNNEL